MNRTSKQAFENAIADVLLTSGYHRHFSQEFDRENAIFPNEVLAFIQFTQPKVWEKKVLAISCIAILEILTKLMGQSFYYSFKWCSVPQPMRQNQSSLHGNQRIFSPFPSQLLI